MPRWIPLLLVLAPLTRAEDDPVATVAGLELGRRYDDAELRRAASAKEPAARRAAARAAARLKDERALAWLWPLVRDAEGPVRRAALFALGQIGSKDAVIPLRGLLNKLRSADLPYALEALGKTGDARAVAAVTRYLRHVDAYVRGEAALALFRLKDPSALPDVFTALGKELQPEPRWRLVYAAWRLLQEKNRRAEAKTSRADEWWTPLLRAAAATDRPFHERVFALRGLAHVEGAHAHLEALLDDADPRIVVACVRGLARQWDRKRAPRIVALLQHEDALLRGVALDHLLAGAKDDGALLRDISGRVASHHALRVRALAAAAAAGEDVAVKTDGFDGPVEHLEELIWRVHSYFPERLAARAPRTRPGRVAAAEVCGEERVRDEVAVPVLRELLKVDDFVVRAVAITSLAKRGAKGQAGTIVGTARKTPGTRDMDVRIEAANALKTLQVYDPWLHDAERDPDHPVRAAARAALEELGRKVAPSPPAGGFRLHGHDAAGILAAAQALRGARVRLRTNRGTIEMVLRPEQAPAHCVNLAVLVQRGFYDGLTWHRVVGNFVIQGGCPRGDGWGGPGYLLPDELAVEIPDRYLRGTVGMPKAGDDTGGCQIFVTHLPTPHLDGRYTIFAQVVSGFDVMDKIRVGDRIEKATIELPGER